MDAELATSIFVRDPTAARFSRLAGAWNQHRRVQGLPADWSRVLWNRPKDSRFARSLLSRRACRPAPSVRYPINLGYLYIAGNSPSSLRMRPRIGRTS